MLNNNQPNNLSQDRNTPHDDHDQKSQSLGRFMNSTSKSLSVAQQNSRSLNNFSIPNQSSVISPNSNLAARTFFGKVPESDEERKEEEPGSKTTTDFVRNRGGKGGAPYLRSTEKDKDRDDEEGMKEMYDHIVKAGQEDKSNFAKIKHMMNYPFRSINDKFAEPSPDRNDVELSFEFFKNFYSRLLEVHKKCGSNCVHLQRFYKKIGYTRGLHSKREFNVSKLLVDKLPKIYY